MEVHKENTGSYMGNIPPCHLLWLDLEALLELLSVRLEVDEVAEADGSFAGYGRTTPAAVLAIGPKDESPCCNIEEMSPMPGFEVMPRLERADAQ